MTRRATVHLRQVARSFLGTHSAMTSFNQDTADQTQGDRQVQVSTPRHALRSSLCQHRAAASAAQYRLRLSAAESLQLGSAAGQSESWASVMGARRRRVRNASVRK